MNNTYIQDYRKAIRSGEIVAGRELIDELRCRNGNLEISLCDIMGGAEEL